MWVTSKDYWPSAKIPLRIPLLNLASKIALNLSISFKCQTIVCITLFCHPNNLTIITISLFTKRIVHSFSKQKFLPENKHTTIFSHTNRRKSIALLDIWNVFLYSSKICFDFFSLRVINPFLNGLWPQLGYSMILNSICWDSSSGERKVAFLWYYSLVHSDGLVPVRQL